MSTFSYLTLLIVCTLIFGAHSYTPFKEFDPYPFASPDTCGSASSSWVTAVRNALAPAQRVNLITNATELLHFAEDYGHIYHRAPQAAFVAPDANAVVALVNVAKSLRNTANKFQIVVRGGSGNVQGAAQVACDSSTTHQVLLDTSLLSSVSITGNSAWVGAGTPWLTLLEAAAAQNLRPTVLPDYMGLTLGGFVSIGGFGPDSAGLGPGVDQVTEIQLVTPTGLLLTVGPLSPYFQAVRGGLGNFGIITAVKYKLVANAAETRTYRVLTANFSAYFLAMQQFVDHHVPSKLHTIQSFAISNAEFNLEIFVAPKAELDLVRPAVDAVLAQPQPYVYFLEMTIRGTENYLTKAQVAALLPAGIDGQLIFTSDGPTMFFDNRLKLFTVPALTANNGSWFKRHPWGSYNFPDSKISTFKALLDNYDPLADSGFGLIAIYPYKTSRFQRNSFFQVPRSDEHFYHLTLGQNELTDTQAGLDHIAANNRAYWNSFAAGADSTIYPTLYVPDWTPADWQKHYGPARWVIYRLKKKILDPYFLLADTRNFGFASLY